ncbi:response regulator transcription factor [Dictyobacter formicarum]|uniref:HTH luxR-type domain-containing protein n=1 Tax=Dictyobacter formicarum TaxID=2778368 RepID=A0ABQ3VQK9_9CHLR|nr:LuxR C-terminal-related transcriptional regulator [Dictyobacter formicarum]GHO87678.1 hypothetical protein KSZ_56840 [Dictyobacter formicarum]
MEHHVWIVLAHLLLGALFLDCLALTRTQHHLEHALALGKEIGASLLLSVVVGFLALTYIVQHALDQAATLLETVCGATFSLQTQIQRLVGCVRVAALIAQGTSNHDLASILSLSERTIEKHAEHLLLKLNFTSHAEIAVWAVEKGLVDKHA